MIKALRSNLTTLIHGDLGTNLGLAFDRFVDEANESGKNAEVKDKLIKNYASFKYQSKKDKTYSLAFQEWKNLQENRKDTLCLTLRSLTPVLLGSGNASVFDIGLQLNKPWGVPYIGGSTIKGVLSAYLFRFGGDTWARSGNADKSAAQVEIFGGTWNNESYSGNVIFNDAWWAPNDSNWFQEDIITVHHTGYYGEESFPHGMDDPVPVKILALKPDMDFFVSFEGPAETLDLIRKVLPLALKEVGLGAKTSVGYGRFETVKSSKELKDELLSALKASVSRKVLLDVFNENKKELKDKNNRDLKSVFLNQWEKLPDDKTEAKEVQSWLYPFSSLTKKVEQAAAGKDRDAKTLDSLNSEFNEIKKKPLDDNIDELKCRPNVQHIFNLLVQMWPDILTGPLKDRKIVKELHYSWEHLAWNDDLLVELSEISEKDLEKRFYMTKASLKDFLKSAMPKGCSKEYYEIVLGSLE